MVQWNIRSEVAASRNHRRKRSCGLRIFQESADTIYHAGIASWYREFGDRIAENTLAATMLSLATHGAYHSLWVSHNGEENRRGEDYNPERPRLSHHRFRVQLSEPRPASTRMQPSIGQPPFPDSFLPRRNGRPKTKPGGCPDRATGLPRGSTGSSSGVRECIWHGGRFR